VAVGLRVRHVTGGDVGVVNLAVAVSDCDGCEAVAVSLQVVLVTARHPRVDAANRALSSTVGCHHCTSLAIATQLVVATPTLVRLAPATARRVSLARDRLRQLASGDGQPSAQVGRRVAGLSARLEATIMRDVRQRTRPDRPPGRQSAKTPRATTHAPPAGAEEHPAPPVGVAAPADPSPLVAPPAAPQRSRVHHRHRRSPAHAAAEPAAPAALRWTSSDPMRAVSDARADRGGRDRRSSSTLVTRTVAHTSEAAVAQPPVTELAWFFVVSVLCFLVVAGAARSRRADTTDTGSAGARRYS
jgi:hypothetical protein